MTNAAALDALTCPVCQTQTCLRFACDLGPAPASYLRGAITRFFQDLLVVRDEFRLALTSLHSADAEGRFGEASFQAKQVTRLELKMVNIQSALHRLRCQLATAELREAA